MFVVYRPEDGLIKMVETCHLFLKYSVNVVDSRNVAVIVLSLQYAECNVVTQK
jgi:hypothetical protein